MHPDFLAVLDISARQLQSLQKAVDELHSWYRASARDLPWRRTRAPYPIWVSEVMLQQTRVAAVIPYFERWMDRFPSVTALAAADEHHVLSAWEGLGYYSRARNLHRGARAVVDRFSGRVPKDLEAFRSIPGVGPYTAAAVLSIAFDRDLAVVDGNVRRVLSRLAALNADPRRAPHSRALDQLAQALLPPGTAATHNQALMELGAVVCTPSRAECARCALGRVCRAGASGSPTSFPARTPRSLPPHHDVALGIVHRGEHVFIDRRPYGGLLGGLWEFPGGKVEPGETPEQALHRELREEFGMRVEPTRQLAPVHHAYTHLRVILYPFVCRLLSLDPRAGEGQPWRWVAPRELPDYPMPRANRKVLEQLWARQPQLPSP
jgi:A/G-specific adenine glycosylase